MKNFKIFNLPFLYIKVFCRQVGVPQTNGGAFIYVPERKKEVCVHTNPRTKTLAQNIVATALLKDLARVRCD